MRRFILAAVMALATTAAAIESDPLPVPADGPRQKATTLYNEGVRLLLDKRYGEAQRRFEDALQAHESFAEAHNNLAFVLRMQGPANNERSLRHYARALELNPKLAQAYVYRGTLHTQMGNLAAARADLESLRPLDPALAARLEKVIAERDPSVSPRDGVTGEVEDIYR